MVVVRVFKKHGAIPLVKGNNPTGCLAYHSANDVWGVSKNPWNEERTCGGSTGGDSGLLAANCVVFSLGGDMLGSLRVPAVFCGINGFLPSGHRVSPYGVEALAEGGTFVGEVIRGCVGPMARNVDDLIYLYREYLGEELFEEDLRLPKLNFKNELLLSTLSSKKLKIGLLKNTEDSFGL